MKPLETITQFDRYLDRLGLTLNAVIIGGSALALLGIITRETRDCDVVYPQLQDAIVEAAGKFADQMRKSGVPLENNWLNNNPMPITKILPPGWMERSKVVFQGKALTLFSLARNDLLLTKLFAYCDRGTDLGDCLALKPTEEELKTSLPWISKQDANPDWPRHVDETIRDLARRLSHGF